MVPEIRIDVRVDVLLRPPETSTYDLIKAHSRAADLVFLGMNIPEEGGELAYATNLLRLLDGLPPTLLVRNAGEFRGRLV